MAAAGGSSFLPIYFEVVDARRCAGEGGLSYWVYKIKMLTRHPVYAGQPHFPLQSKDSWYEIDGEVQILCERRYSDFEWLHTALVAETPATPIPPIPIKAASGTVDKVLDYLSPDSDTSLQPLVTDRMAGLTLFLQYLGESQQLASSSILRHFLLRNDLSSLKAEVASNQSRRPPPPTPSTSMSEWVRGFFTGPRPPRIPRHLTKKKEFAATLSQALRTVQKQWSALANVDSSMREAVTAALLHSGPPATQEQHMSQSTAVAGCRVIDSEGHKGTVRWVGNLPNVPKPDMLYVGVEWDEPGHGKYDGSFHGEQLFKCRPDCASFHPPEVLSRCPDEGADALLTALNQTTKEIGVTLSASNDQGTSQVSRVNTILQFWGHMAGSVVTAIGYIEGLYATTSEFESQGAADGKSPELATLKKMINDAEDVLQEEWEYFHRRWKTACAELVHSTTRILENWEPAQCYLGPGLVKWIDFIESPPSPPAPPLNSSPAPSPPRSSDEEEVLVSPTEIAAEEEQHDTPAQPQDEEQGHSTKKKNRKKKHRDPMGK